MNNSLKEMLGMLLAQHQALSTRLDDVTDPAEARTLITEMQELLHRADLVQNLLLIETSKRLDTAVDRVRGADRELTAALKKVERANQLIKAVSDFLAHVDRAIDLAKKVAVLAAV